MSSSDFELEQAEDRLPIRKLATIAAVAFAIGTACVIIAGLLARANAPSRQQSNQSYAAPPGTVEYSLIDTTSRGLDQVSAQHDFLTQYGWVDRAHGVARIPIDRAMDLTVERKP